MINKKNINQYEHQYKLAVVGAGGVGKSSLTVQFTQNIFIEEYDPTIEDSYRKHIQIDNNIYLLEILDTAGQEEYKALRDQYMRLADGFLLIYSIIDIETFQEIDEYYQQILRVKDIDNIPMVLVGNKCDLESQREVNKNEAIKYTNKINIPFIETSAKSRLNIDEIFYKLVRQIISFDQPIESTNKLNKNTKCCII
jgi:GTPase KRas protein